MLSHSGSLNKLNFCFFVSLFYLWVSIYCRLPWQCTIGSFSGRGDISWEKEILGYWRTNKRCFMAESGERQRVLKIYRGPGFHAVHDYRLCAHPLPPPLPPVRSTRDTQEDWEREHNLLTGERGEGWGGAEWYDRKKAWSSINHSILSGVWRKEEAGWGKKNI